MPTPELIALNCAKCGAPLGEGLSCGYCGTSFEKVLPAAKRKISVAGENLDLRVDGITFDRRVGFNDEQLTAIAGQVAAAMAAGPEEPRRDYLDFSLPLPPTPGRPPALFVEAHRVEDGGLRVLFVSDYDPVTHQRLQGRGRVLNFPLK